METSIIDHSDIEKEIQITLSQEELLPHFDKAYKKEQAKIEIKGFRKGKAPLDMIKRIYGEAIQYEALDTIANDVYRSVITERNIYPLGEPALTDINYKPGEPFTFKVKYEVQPTFEVNDYRNVPVEKLIHHVTDDEVDEEIERVQHANSELAEVEEVTDEEHVVTLDIQELDDTGSPLVGKKSSGAKLYLNEQTLAPEIRYALTNVKKGESRRVNFEYQHGEHKHLNNWEMTPTKIEKVVIPELTDEFVKKATKLKVDTVDQFRQNVKKDIERYWIETSEQQVKNMLVDEIVRRHDIPVPNALVRSLTDARIEEIKNQSQGKKLPADFNETEFRENYKAFAIHQAKWFLIRDKIIEKEQLTVTDADLEKRAEEDAPKMSIEKERLLTFYKSSDALKERLIYEKLMNFLLEHAVISEKIHQPEETA